MDDESVSNTGLGFLVWAKRGVKSMRARDYYASEVP